MRRGALMRWGWTFITTAESEFALRRAIQSRQRVLKDAVMIRIVEPLRHQHRSRRDHDPGEPFALGRLRQHRMSRVSRPHGCHRFDRRNCTSTSARIRVVMLALTNFARQSLLPLFTPLGDTKLTDNRGELRNRLLMSLYQEAVYRGGNRGFDSVFDAQICR